MRKASTLTAIALAAGLTTAATSDADAQQVDLRLDFGNGTFSVDSDGDVGARIRGNGIDLSIGTGDFDAGRYGNGTACRNAAARELRDNRELRRDGHMDRGEPKQIYRAAMRDCRNEFKR